MVGEPGGSSTNKAYVSHETEKTEKGQDDDDTLEVKTRQGKVHDYEEYAMALRECEKNIQKGWLDTELLSINS